jgi:CheY-like chemotaxis protein
MELAIEPTATAPAGDNRGRPAAEATVRIRNDPDPDGVARTRAGAVPHPTRVLVVDDNLDSTECLCLILQAWGHEARVAHDGQGGLDSARVFDPEVVLLDIDLPDLDGFEVARRLRSRGAATGTVLVAISGHAPGDDPERWRGARFDHVLTKPLDFLALERLLAPRFNSGGPDASGRVMLVEGTD